jgi:RNA polymerase-binding transcription factor DksA
MAVAVCSVDQRMEIDPAEQLRRLREATAERIVGLLRERDGIVASADLTGTDDEHDPEGATLAFEREQISALLRAARERLQTLDAALERVEHGRYGSCSVCGGPIPPGRLAARPDTTTCVGCAASRAGR